MMALAAVAGVAALGAVAAHAQVQSTGALAHGLLIRLKNGATAQSLDQLEQAQAKRTERLHGVMREAGLPEHAIRTRPVGRVLQHIDFGKVLQADEAEQLMQRLAARPEVEWVRPNRMERRLATPFDPGFSPGFFPSEGGGSQVPQWWLYAVGGTNADPISLRRRGLPGFQRAWDRSNQAKGLPTALVAVLDTGIVHHSQLAGHILDGYDFVSDPRFENDGTGGRDGDATDPGDWVTAEDVAAYPSSCPFEEESSWHGTNIAGLIAARTNDGIGTASINWQGRILPVRVAGKCGATVADILDGMRWAAGLSVPGVPDNPPQNHARIINLSFGGPASLGCADYQDVIDELKARGVVIIAAAGNEQSAVSRPARCPGVIGVTATNRDGFKANYSNFGPEAMLATVGGDPQAADDDHGNWSSLLGDEGLLGLNINGKQRVDAIAPYGYATLFGTSFSAPVVAGAVSLMLSVNPALTYDQIVEGLKVSARKHVTSNHMPECSASSAYGRCICTTATCGVGLLDAEQALLYAESPATYVATGAAAVNIDSPAVVSAVQAGPDEPDAESVGGGGGGALQPAWLAALALVTLLTAAASRAASRRRTRRR